jgi:prolyl oligopeptidase
MQQAMIAGLAAWLLAVLPASAGAQQMGKPDTTHTATTLGTADPYLWLEDVTAPDSLDWVRARNATTVGRLESGPRFASLRTGILEVLDSDARIPMVDKMGAYYYNFWKDKQHERGIWRRTTLDEYRKADPAWETVLDLDALNATEHTNWVWHGADCLKPADPKQPWRHCLIALSRGGSDADVTREFDLATKQFVPNGFQRAEAKGALSWKDVDTVYVGTDFGPGSMTPSGYPRIAKEWKRGTPVDAATVVYEGKPDDVAITAFRDHSRGYERDFVSRALTFYTDELYLRSADGKLVKIDVPDSAKKSVHRQWLLLELRDPWTIGDTTWPAGSLIATRFDDFMAGKRAFEPLFTPTATASLEGYNWTKNHLLLNVLDNVKSRIKTLAYLDVDSGVLKRGWNASDLVGVPSIGTVTVAAIDDEESDAYFMTVTDYLTPTTLYLGDVGQQPERIKATPAFFDASGLEISQHFATSKDGTRVPYFMVAKKNLQLDGSHPTLLYGYGGFEISLTPSYSGGVGRSWLTRDGKASNNVYVVANIRGGGEFGPRWHQAAMRENRLRAYEDFAAVAEDLIARKVTSPKYLGIQGGSNGGLLVGNMFVLYPQLFGAVVCQVPLLDMKRYSHMLAGASWMAEYGDPDTADWDFIKTFSPYQNVSKGVAYPPVLFMTSTRDDRVHPGHARKMMARMLEQGHDVLYYENIEGGHGGAADNQQLATMSALAYVFLEQELIGK